MRLAATEAGQRSESRGSTGLGQVAKYALSRQFWDVRETETRTKA
jgi:hypothetical protein